MKHKTCLLGCKASEILHSGVKEIAIQLGISSSDFQRAAVCILADMYHSADVSRETLREEIIRCNLQDLYLSVVGGTAEKFKSVLRVRIEN